MTTLLTGSLAFDTLAEYDDTFSRQILAKNIETLSVSFPIKTLKKAFGGTAGNIAYSMKLLGSDPLIWATAGNDFEPYHQWLSQKNISTKGIQIISDEFTAQAFIITDTTGNQIASFYGGAMFLSHLHPLQKNTEISRIVVSPNGKDSMIQHVEFAKKQNIPFWFDPGQSIPVFSGTELINLATNSELLICNEYEWKMFSQKTDIKNTKDLFPFVQNIIITYGEKGSVYHSPSQQFTLDAIPVTKVVDPTGCGDAFRAGLLVALASGKTWKEGMQQGAKIAAKCVTKSGAQNHTRYMRRGKPPSHYSSS